MVVAILVVVKEPTSEEAQELDEAGGSEERNR
jgi:hypothetical protein